MPRPTSRRARVAVAVGAVALAACGAGEAAAPDSPPPTLGDIGDLPGELKPTETSAASTTRSMPPATTGREARSTTSFVAPAVTIASDRDERLPIGRMVDGNRVLVIGDSILASISDRFGGQLCDRLVPLGWAVEVDAESGRDVTFGLDVIDDRLDVGWDAAVVMLGNNYRDNVRQFAADMEELVRRLAPRPTLLLTVTEFESSRAEVNFVVRSLAQEYAHVRLVDWADLTRDADDLLGDDGLHLSEEGRDELAWQITKVLLRAPGTGVCLDSDYDDDSEAPGIDLGEDDDDDDDDDEGFGGDDDDGST